MPLGFVMSDRRWALLAFCLAAACHSAALGGDSRGGDALLPDGAAVDGANGDASGADGPTVDGAVHDAAVTDGPADGGSMSDARSDARPIDGQPDAMPDAGITTDRPPVGTCRDGWCWVLPQPQGNPLRGIWGAAPNDVWTIGDHGALLHYDGLTWTDYGGGALMWGCCGGQLWGTGSQDVWAATAASGVLHWNGSSWTIAKAGDLTVVGGTGPSDVWAYDAKNVRMLQWDGLQWNVHPVPTSAWQAIALGGEPGGLVTVSRAGAIAKWSGTTWAILDPGTHAANAALVIDSAHVAIAQNGTVSLWTNGVWTDLSTPVAANWNAISGTSTSDIWVAGFLNGAVYNYHWDGLSWTSFSDVGDTGWPQALWVDSTGAVWAAMSDAEVRVNSGTGWVPKTVGDNYVQSVWGTSESDIWVVSAVEFPARNRVTHWDGASWKEAAFSFDTSYSLGRIWGAASDDYWIAAGHRISNSVIERVLFHWNGSSWSAAGTFGTEDGAVGPQGFTAVWGSSVKDVYAVAQTAVYHYDGTTWAPVADLPGGQDVFGTSADDVHVIQGNIVWNWNGAKWSSVTAPDSVYWGWTNSPADIWLVGFGADLHYDGAASFATFDSSANDGLGVPLGTGTEMFTFSVALNGAMTRWVGGFGGTPVQTRAFFNPRNGWVAPDGAVYAAGNGLLVH